MTTAIRTLLNAILAIGLFAAGQATASTPQVALHLLPDANAPIHTDADLNVLDRFNPQPVVSKDFVGQGWETVLYRGNYTGYVRNNLLAGSYVRPGAQIHMEPNAQSPVMQTLQNPRHAVLEGRVNDEWSKVTFNGIIPLYFIRSNAQIQDAAKAGISAEVSRALVGKLERVGSLNRLFGGSYEYRLVDEKGNTIAYVDAANALFVGNIENYWDKWVAVEGLARQRSGKVPLVIEARFISAR